MAEDYHSYWHLWELSYLVVFYHMLLFHETHPQRRFNKFSAALHFSCSFFCYNPRLAWPWGKYERRLHPQIHHLKARGALRIVISAEPSSIHLPVNCSINQWISYHCAVTCLWSVHTKKTDGKNLHLLRNTKAAQNTNSLSPEEVEICH